jgi:hypothetical protein
MPGHRFASGPRGAGFHTCRATGFTIYLEIDGQLEHAQRHPRVSENNQVK